MDEHAARDVKGLDLDDVETLNAEEEVDYVAEAFRRGGHIASQLDGYEPRTGQVEMAYEVAGAMAGGHNLLCEAPTGVGKSCAYGVPAAWHASRGEKVVIVTANISLQEQLVKKDLPMLERALPWRFTYALAKGLQNYACLSKFDETATDVVLDGSIEGTELERDRWAQVVRWVGTTTQGDLSELDFEPSPYLKSKFTVSADDCSGRRCKRFQDCHGHRARQRARSAGVVVTNYAMFFSDLAIKMGGGEGVLPKYSHVVFDEGHKASEAARGFMGFSVSRWSVANAIKLLDAPTKPDHPKGELASISKALKGQAVKTSEALFAALLKHLRSKEYNVRFRRAWAGDLLGRAADFQAAMRECSRAYADHAGEGYLEAARKHELEALAGRCAAMASNVETVAHHKGEGWVYHLEEVGSRERPTIALKGSPVSVADYLRSQVFEKKDGPNAIKSVTVTSATLATSEDDYKYVCEQLGLRNAEQVTVECPFDVAANTLLVTPPMPDPQSDRFSAEVAKKIVDVVRMAGGRTLCLFTSHRMLNLVHELIKNEGPFKGIDGRPGLRLLRQGDAPRTRLVEQFRGDVTSVLMGTDSFWAGVDVPGESCSVVVIDKLPFPNLSDPVQDYLKTKLGKRYFMDVSVPAAVITTRQGCGRLLRTTSDRGVIVFLDGRVRGKGYGSKFVRSFPRDTELTRDLDAVGEFLSRVKR